jgi:hypothetical protein
METSTLEEESVITVVQSAWFISCQSNHFHQGKPLMCGDTQQREVGAIAASTSCFLAFKTQR